MLKRSDEEERRMTPPATMLKRSDEEERRMTPPATMQSEAMRRSGA
jgi:hypothetical protein